MATRVPPVWPERTWQTAHVSTHDTYDTGDELVRLASADNFRDVAGPGHRTLDDGRLRQGVFFRSNELQLSAADAGALLALGVSGIYDLRDDYEVARHPDVEVPGADWEHLEVKGIPHGAASGLADVEEASETMRSIYRRFVTDPASRRSFGTLLHRLAASAGPQLFHCTAGKDRTGWAATLLLHLAGVGLETIEVEYLLTNHVSTATREKYLGLVAEHLGVDRIPVFERLMVADLDYLHAAFDAADQAYGSLDGYLTEGLGLSAETRAALRTRLVDA